MHIKALEFTTLSDTLSRVSDRNRARYRADDRTSGAFTEARGRAWRFFFFLYSPARISNVPLAHVSVESGVSLTGRSVCKADPFSSRWKSRQRYRQYLERSRRSGGGGGGKTPGSRRGRRKNFPPDRRNARPMPTGYSRDQGSIKVRSVEIASAGKRGDQRRRSILIDSNDLRIFLRALWHARRLRSAAFSSRVLPRPVAVSWRRKFRGGISFRRGSRSLRISCDWSGRSVFRSGNGNSGWSTYRGKSSLGCPPRGLARIDYYSGPANRTE